MTLIFTGIFCDFLHLGKGRPVIETSLQVVDIMFISWKASIKILAALI